MTDSPHTYKIIELVGSSPESIDSAIRNALSRANQTLHNIDWFEVREIRGYVADGEVGAFQVKLGVGFRILESADLAGT